MLQPSIETLTIDLLILGGGGAGLFATTHAYEANLNLSILITVKGLIGKSGCTRMVQGGYNAVLHASDSLDQHFRDTIEEGAYLNSQEMAWTLIKTALERIRELENRMSCFFDRNPDGTIHQKAFAGQSFDRTVYRGDLTGIEIMTPLMEQVFRHNIPAPCRHGILHTDGGFTWSVEVYRHDPEAHSQGRMVPYQVPRLEKITVLDALIYIQRHHDRSLAFRYACRLGMCGACYASCTMQAHDPEYLGPAALNRAFTLVRDWRDGARAERLSVAGGEHGCWPCHSLFNCTEVCPKHLSPTRAIVGLKRAIVLDWLRSRLAP